MQINGSMQQTTARPRRRDISAEKFINPLLRYGRTFIPMQSIRVFCQINKKLPRVLFAIAYMLSLSRGLELHQGLQLMRLVRYYFSTPQ